MAAHAHKNEFFPCQAISSRKGPPGRPVLRRVLAKRPRAKMVHVKHQSAARGNNPCSQTTKSTLRLCAMFNASVLTLRCTIQDCGMHFRRISHRDLLVIFPKIFSATRRIGINPLAAFKSASQQCAMFNAPVDMAAYDSGLSLWSPKSASIKVAVFIFWRRRVYYPMKTAQRRSTLVSKKGSRPISTL